MADQIIKIFQKLVPRLFCNQIISLEMPIVNIFGLVHVINQIILGYF